MNRDLGYGDDNRIKETSPLTTCHICHESLESNAKGYCSTHALALDNLKHAYEVWAVAYVDITVSDFLKRLASLRETGEKAKEVARFLLENPSRWR
jgi:hypothetical protein